MHFTIPQNTGIIAMWISKNWNDLKDVLRSGKAEHKSLSCSSIPHLEKSNFIIVTEVLRSPYISTVEQDRLTLPHSLTEMTLTNASENGIFPGSLLFPFASSESHVT